MGYYSDFNGSFSPECKLADSQSAQIMQWFVERFGGYSMNSDGTIKFDTVNGDGTRSWYNGAIVFRPGEYPCVEPACSNMKGYDFNEHLYEFVEWLKHEIPTVSFSGEVERTGEEFGDVELIRLLDGKVLSYSGSIRYDSPVVVCETEQQKHNRFFNSRRSAI